MDNAITTTSEEHQKFDALRKMLRLIIELGEVELDPAEIHKDYLEEAFVSYMGSPSTEGMRKEHRQHTAQCHVYTSRLLMAAQGLLPFLKASVTQEYDTTVENFVKSITAVM